MLRSIFTSMSVAIGGLGLLATPALASKVKPDSGVSVTRDAQGRYCLRATNDEVATRFGTRIYRRQCLTEQRWARDGVRFHRRDGGPRSNGIEA